ncbi:uncharacterized protein EURHEDRAFT_417749 [Aspergillus ruber CBS 135680]|uniref:Secreted protein n=1 Tax=Aspergillus ruber (strain CBS 135680) TaxID=1388766 RepID=A0A017RZZ5_ASPRC|nr:uncharacterized protein EURHEDRAFT_417749 [Aspergillus ruber CBS 135680]EYE90136.1 hypothetical protein EURHEDRAFT_417749 [Aspergillus ruber CBS 135680]
MRMQLQKGALPFLLLLCRPQSSSTPMGRQSVAEILSTKAGATTFSAWLKIPVLYSHLPTPWFPLPHFSLFSLCLSSPYPLPLLAFPFKPKAQFTVRRP